MKVLFVVGMLVLRLCGKKEANSCSRAGRTSAAVCTSKTPRVSTAAMAAITCDTTV